MEELVLMLLLLRGEEVTPEVAEVREVLRAVEVTPLVVVLREPARDVVPADERLPPT